MAGREVTAPKGTLTGQEVTAQGSDTTGVMIGGKLFTAVRVVNVPTLKHDTGQVVAFQILQPLKLKENETTEDVVVDGKTVKATKKNRLHVARVLELTTRQEFEYVCNAITAGDLIDSYPPDDTGKPGYVGKWFAIQKGSAVQGKRYKEVKIIEIQPDDAVTIDGATGEVQG